MYMDIAIAGYATETLISHRLYVINSKLKAVISAATTPHFLESNTSLVKKYITTEVKDVMAAINKVAATGSPFVNPYGIAKR